MRAIKLSWIIDEKSNKQLAGVRYLPEEPISAIRQDMGIERCYLRSDFQLIPNQREVEYFEVDTDEPAAMKATMAQIGGYLMASEIFQEKYCILGKKVDLSKLEGLAVTIKAIETDLGEGCIQHQKLFMFFPASDFGIPVMTTEEIYDYVATQWLYWHEAFGTLSMTEGSTDNDDKHPRNMTRRGHIPIGLLMGDYAQDPMMAYRHNYQTPGTGPKNPKTK